MKRLFIALLMMVPVALHASDKDSLTVMFWNLENFFDYIDQGTSPSDKEFSWSGTRHWTKKRFYSKCNAVAKTVLWVGDRYGHLPDVIGFAEIENRFVLERLIWSTALRKSDYRIVHYESPDQRGIDVALLYRKEILDPVSSRPCHVTDSTLFRTRDILVAEFKDADGSRSAFLVNHHPSKYGGSGTGSRRLAAVRALKAVSDSLQLSGVQTLVAMGDFNETPENEVFDGLFHEPFPLVNKALSLYGSGRGSIRFNGHWELIDMFFVPEKDENCCRMELLAVPFLTVHDNTHSGDKPLRTYSGPRYIGGVSDHLPVLLRYSRY